MHHPYPSTKNSMLVYNLKKVFNARGIDKPIGFLRRQGFTDSHAFYLKEGKVIGMRLKTIEKLCIALNCTPNDLIEWIPDKSLPLAKDHALNQLKQRKKSVDLASKLQSVPMDKLEGIEKFIDEETKIKKDSPT